MNTRIALYLCVCLCLTGVLQADTRWQGTVDSAWDNPANWTNGVPNATQKAQFVTVGEPTCTVTVAGAEAKQLAVGDNTGGSLKIAGGSLKVMDWSILGYAEANVGDQAGHLTVTGGELNCQARIFVGFMGEGHLTVDDEGVVNVYNQPLGIGEEKTGNGYVYLKGGTLNLWAGGLAIHLFNAKAHVDFTGGTMTLTNTVENRNAITKGIADGIITAYGGVGKVVVDLESTPGRIILKGIHPLTPAPVDGGRVSAGQVQLNWVLPDPCQPGQQVLVDVYFGTSPDFPEGGSPETPQIISKKNRTSATVQTQPKVRYYWAVDTYIGSAQDPVYGPLFSFVADNLIPTVEAGNDQVAWLTDGSVKVALDAKITDDGFLKPCTALWTVVSGPNDATPKFADAKAEDTTITLNATGEYVLKLEAYDGEYTGSDTVTINVFNDSCEAAQFSPDYVPIPGDINGDCVVNDADLAILQSHWLECNALDCNSVK
jgi:T5SS/PEP-CTERM-associated repeat protein